MKIVTAWPIELAGNFRGRIGALMMDRRHSRLFLGGQQGLVVLSATDGHELARVPIKSGVDQAVFWNDTLFAYSGDGR